MYYSNESTVYAWDFITVRVVNREQESSLDIYHSEGKRKKKYGPYLLKYPVVFFSCYHTLVAQSHALPFSIEIVKAMLEVSMQKLVGLRVMRCEQCSRNPWNDFYSLHWFRDFGIVWIRREMTQLSRIHTRTERWSSMQFWDLHEHHDKLYLLMLNL